MPNRTFPNTNNYPDQPYYNDMLSACLVNNNDGSFSIQTTGGGGGGSATAANQTTQITLATDANGLLGSIDASNSNIQSSAITISALLSQMVTNSTPMVVGMLQLNNTEVETIPADSAVFYCMQQTGAGVRSRITNYGQYMSGMRTISPFELLFTLETGNTFDSIMTIVNNASNAAFYPVIHNQCANPCTVTNTSGNTLFFFYVQAFA